MRMLFISGSSQNYQNGAVSNQLTDVGRKWGERVGGGVRLFLICDREVHCSVCHPKKILQIPLNLYFSRYFLPVGPYFNSSPEAGQGKLYKLL
jgi:hypothetical protein